MRLLIIIPFILVACSNKPEQVTMYEHCLPPTSVNVFCLDSCEYINIDNSCIIHKANCRNPIHINQLKQLNNEPRTKKR